MMSTRITKYFAVLLLPLLVACAPVQKSNELSQPTNTRLTAGINTVIFGFSKYNNSPDYRTQDTYSYGYQTPTGGNWPNGRMSDISSYGRQIPAGMTAVEYLGVRNGKAIFRRSSITIQIYNAATMNRPTPLTPQEDQGPKEIAVDLKKDNKSFVVEGKTIIIESADDTQVVYSISE